MASIVGVSVRFDSYEAGRLAFKPGKKAPKPTGQSVDWWRGYYTAWHECVVCERDGLHSIAGKA